MQAKALEAVVRKSYRSFRAFYLDSDLDIPYSTFMRYFENDEQFNKMPINNFKKIAKALDMPAEDLMSMVIEYSEDE